MNILVVDNNIIDLSWLSSRILSNEKSVIKKYPAKSYDFKYDFDGQTGLGYESLTSRSCHYNLLSWWGTRKLKQCIKDGYNTYNSVNNKHIFVQCWANVMRKGEKIHPHAHSPFQVKPIHALSGHLCVKVDGTTSTYYDGSPIHNVNGQMTFFPSTVSHWTDRYLGDSERITIAFDICSEEWFNFDMQEAAKKRWIKL